MQTGATHQVSVTVDESNVASKMKSGSLEVFATPALVALMEQAAAELCEKYLQPELTTVGTAINIEHLAPSCMGAQVVAVAELTAFEGKKISFSLQASDGAGIVGKGTHERFIVDSRRFMEKAGRRAGK